MASNGDARKLWLVCDVSGSMSENGKAMLQRGVVRLVEQCIRFGHAAADLRLVAWGSTAEDFSWNPDDEFPERLLCPEGASNADALLEFLGANPADAVLVVTDGWWPMDEARKLKRWKRGQPPGKLRILKIGGDANPLLKGSDVFGPDDIFALFDEWLPGTGSADEQETGDEW